MSLITVEVEIDHGSLMARDSHLLPDRGVGLLTVVRSEESPQREKHRVELPLVHCVPGSIVNPTTEELDESLWG